MTEPQPDDQVGAARKDASLPAVLASTPNASARLRGRMYRNGCTGDSVCRTRKRTRGGVPAPTLRAARTHVGRAAVRALWPRAPGCVDRIRGTSFARLPRKICRTARSRGRDRCSSRGSSVCQPPARGRPRATLQSRARGSAAPPAARAHRRRPASAATRRRSSRCAPNAGARRPDRRAKPSRVSPARGTRAPCRA